MKRVRKMIFLSHIVTQVKEKTNFNKFISVKNISLYLF